LFFESLKDIIISIMSKNRIPVLAILLTVLLFFIQHFSSQPPAPKGMDAPLNEFSAVRAHNILKDLLQENQPHPVGSDLNRVVKERLKVELDKLGVEHQEQKTWACSSRFSNCAEVENLIGIIPGKSDLPYLALMAHYDSVPMAPGAGDDGAGVVAILEAVRALKLEVPYKHPIMLIITDAEESGLLGAEAFFNQHPLAKKVGIVLNIEGSGSSGSSMVLRTSDKNELLIKSYSNQNTSPYGFSFVKEIFKRMPNDTDFSVVERANIAGIDFAFAGERNHYHTPNDTVENIDLRTIQHHGENILPLSRELLSADWEDMGDDYIYGGEVYGFWTQWKSSNSIFICLLSAFLLIAALIKSKINLKRTALGILFSPLTVFTTILSGITGFYLLSLLAGNVISWPGIDWPYRLLLIGSIAIGTLLGTAVSRRFIAEQEMIFGSWFFWLLLTLAITILLPDAANIFILPLIFASLLLLLSTFLGDKHKSNFLLLTLIMTLPMTLGIIFSLEQSQGYKLVWAVLPFAGLYALIVSPFLYHLKIKQAISYIGAVTFIALITGSFTNLYTEKRPQHVNIHFYENLDADQSYIHLSGNYKNVAANDPEPLIEPLSSYVDTQSSKSLISFAKDYESRYWAETNSSGWKGPVVKNKKRLDNGKSIKMNLKSDRSASRMVLLLPKESNLNSFNLGSLEYKTSLSRWGFYKGFYAIYLNGIYDKEVELTLNFDAGQETINGYLIDISTELPDHLEKLYKARTGIFSPVHGGDQGILIKKIKI